jgi:general secretion pathway protein B
VAQQSGDVSSPASAIASRLKSREEAERQNQNAASAKASAPVTVNTSAPPPTAPAQPVQAPQVMPVQENTAVAALYQKRDSAAADSEVTKAVAPTVEKKKQTNASAPTAVDQQEQPLDVEKLLLQARNDTKNAQLVEHPAPFVSSLSQNDKDVIPTVLYQRHDYSNDKAISSVVLNSKSLRVGGSPTAGMKVEEILPDSVVLSYRGIQFRLRSLNSWVNL